MRVWLLACTQVDEAQRCADAPTPAPVAPLMAT